MNHYILRTANQKMLFSTFALVRSAPSAPSLVGIIACAATLLVFCFSLNAQAADVDELKKQIEVKNEQIKKIQEEIRVYNEELSKTNQTSKTLKEKITGLDKNIVNLRRQITLTESQIQQKKLEINRLELMIGEKGQTIRKRQETMGGIVGIFARRQEANLLEIILQYPTISDFFSYLEQNKNFQRELQANLSELRELKSDLEDDQNEAKKKQNELNNFQGILGDKKVITENERKDRQVLLTETKNQEKRYLELITDSEKKYDDVLREIEALEEEFRKQVDPNSLPEKRSGFLLWPSEGRLTQGYGATAFAAYSHFYKFHNGIDIASGSGTEILAAEAGKIIAVGNSDKYCPRGAYGKYIVIDHGNNLITLYAHLSLQKVSVGQEINRGDLIGYMGSSGRSTGTHLHFTVYDARTFELRQSKVCGILPYGGSVNPLHYL